MYRVNPPPFPWPLPRAVPHLLLQHCHERVPLVGAGAAVQQLIHDAQSRVNVLLAAQLIHAPREILLNEAGVAVLQQNKNIDTETL